MFGYLKLQ